MGFDWVAARAGCCLDGIFQALTEGLASDVKSVNKLDRPGVKFSLNTDIANKIMVSRTRDLGGARLEAETVVFELLENEITVSRRDRQRVAELSRVKPLLTPEGECLLVSSENPAIPRLNQMQFRQSMLDSLFFGFTPSSD